MAGGYFSDDQNGKMKELLYPYLMDKAKRRAQSTSGAAYGAQNQEFDDQRDEAKQGAMVSALAKWSSAMGSNLGVQAPTGIASDYFKTRGDATQQAFDNKFKARASEENSLGTDLGIAKFVGDEDYKDKDLKARTSDREEDRKARLQQYLAEIQRKRDADAQHDKEFGMTYGQRERQNKEGNRLREKQIDKPTNPALQGPGAVVPGYVDADGNPITYNARTGASGSLKLPPGAKSTKVNADPNAKGDADIAKKYASDAVKSDGVANMIDAGVREIEAYKAKGDKSHALSAAKNMIKDLNSTFGADAIGAEESKRLAAYLDNLRMDVLGGNYGVGPDIDAFIEQAKGKARSVHAGAATNFSKAKDIREHGLQVGGQTYGDQQTPKTVVKEMRSPSTGKIKRIYSDGSEEVLDGPK